MPPMDAQSGPLPNAAEALLRRAQRSLCPTGLVISHEPAGPAPECRQLWRPAAVPPPRSRARALAQFYFTSDTTAERCMTPVSFENGFPRFSNFFGLTVRR